MLVAFSVAPSGQPTLDTKKSPESAESSAPDASAPVDTSAPDASHADGSVSDAVAAAVQVVRDSGLPHRTDAMFTTIEGEWDEVFAVVKRATEAVAPFGSRVSLVLKADIRPGFEGELDAKLERLERAVAGHDSQ